ncbi:hypothetical protein BGZ82_007659 [Podila clonocystis]|nr:hypothetical protein BGZ82_007659 [Podila clonocystis]
MTTGQLRCIGSSLHLKELYGSGFGLSVTSKPGRLQEFTNATIFNFNIGQATNEGGAPKGELSSIFKSLLQKDQLPDAED